MDNDYLFRILIPLLEKVGFVNLTSIVNNGSKVDIKLSFIAPYRCAISVIGDRSFTVYTNPVDLGSMLWYLLSTEGYVHLVQDINAMRKDLKEKGTN
jgi:hypothetical protein